MRKPRIYSYAAQDKINAELPKTLLDEMRMTGWNVFGVYELVEKVLRAEKRADKRNATTANAAAQPTAKAAHRDQAEN